MDERQMMDESQTEMLADIRDELAVIGSLLSAAWFAVLIAAGWWLYNNVKVVGFHA